MPLRITWGPQTDWSWQTKWIFGDKLVENFKKVSGRHIQIISILNCMFIEQVQETQTTFASFHKAGIYFSTM